MIDKREIDLDDMLDALMELKHDLAKYIALPLSMLPGDADEAQIEEAVRAGLYRTRTGPNGVIEARRIWETFRAEVGDEGRRFEKFEAVEQSVAAALAWDEAIGKTKTWDRDAVRNDFRRVKETIQELVEEVRDASK